MKQISLHFFAESVGSKWRHQKRVKANPSLPFDDHPYAGSFPPSKPISRPYTGRLKKAGAGARQA